MTVPARRRFLQISSLPLAIVCLLMAASPLAQAEEARWEYLDNGVVRLGVNLSAGGCIGWFSRSGTSENLLNAYDVGRYVQQSYYGDKDGSDWNGKPWRYNPVQGGSWKNEPALLRETRLEKGVLYVKTTPRHWASGKLLDEVTMEQWLRLEGGLARLKFKMTYTGEKAHAAYHQELPALFVQPALETLVLPGEDGALVRKQPGFPNEQVKLSGPWIAWVDAQDHGLGLWCPHAKQATCYRVRNNNKGDCSYLAPLQTFALKPGLVFEYEAALMIGSVEEIQGGLSKLQPQP